MTAQIPDTYRYEGEDYDIVALSRPIDFDPTDYGFRPAMFSTACWRGYACDYEITGGQLLLRRLRIHCDDGNYPVFDGVVPAGDTDVKVYDNLRHEIDYNGRIVVGNGFLQEYYIHMGFQRAWAYRNVIELVFKRGKVVNRIDHGPFVEKLRKQLGENPGIFDADGDIVRFVQDSFSLDTDVKAWWI